MGACLMWNISKILSEDSEFLGVISSYNAENELNLFKEYIKNNFANEGGLIYVCSREIKDQCLIYLEDDMDIDLKELVNMNRLIFVHREHFLKQDGIDIVRYMDCIEKAIEKLNGIGTNKKICVYVTIDSFWNSISNEEIKYIYRKMKAMNKDWNAEFIIRYIIEEVSKDIICSVLYYHDHMLVDGVDKFDVTTPGELVHRALILLSEKRAIDFKHNRDIMRTEYLETLGELMGGVVHDINNLLVSILGHAQYCLEINDPKEIENCLKVISRLALDGKSVTEKVKNEVKGDCNSTKDIYKFDYIVRNCIDMVKHKFKSDPTNSRKRLELIESLNSEKFIYANEYDLRHSIINIMLNGIDAMDGFGALTIMTYDDGGRTVLEISDTGCGMDELTLKRVFDPYYTTKGSKGTGLGLSIAKRVFEEYNANIEVESSYGEGTKFTIYFPTVEFKNELDVMKDGAYNIN